ncbi:unnamed protein product [Periconia digitata]|uniref:Uncharacterized protein n=1 Tax=Periconia digitata TaxID=1303443 RepID=A0A9W4UFL6_9PLEO|nr:unnamed protein product [Periconia digitata]
MPSLSPDGMEFEMERRADNSFVRRVTTASCSFSSSRWSSAAVSDRGSRIDVAEGPTSGTESAMPG